MDSQHRHELKENDLAEALTNWRDVWDKYGTPLTLAILVVVLVFAGYRLFGYYQTTTHETAWSDLAATASPEGMAEVADDHGVKPVQLLALLQGADLYLNEAVFPPEIADAAAVGDREDGDNGDTGDEGAGSDNGADADASSLGVDAERVEQRLSRAETMYQRVLDLAEAEVFRANALLGLASVAESRERWDEAASFYDRAKAEAEAGELPELGRIAEHRKSMLDKLKLPVAIVEAPEEPAPDADPAADAGPADDNPSTLPTDLGSLQNLVDEPIEIDITGDSAPTVIEDMQTLGDDGDDEAQ